MSSLREKIFSYVQGRLLAGNPPTIREVQKAMGLKAVESARSHLEALVKEGRLIKHETSSRSYALPPEVWLENSARKVPILGQVQAGELTYADEELEGYVQVQRQREGEELFALRVRGWSMRDAGILPEDLLIVRRQGSADSGDIVVAWFEGEATVKRLLRRPLERKVFLQPANEDFAVIEVPVEELRLLGKVLEVRRSYEGGHSL